MASSFLDKTFLSSEPFGGLNKKLARCGAGGILATILGFFVAFLSLKLKDFSYFVTAGVIAWLLIIIDCAIGLYCWRLLYLTYRNSVSWSSYALGIAAALVPAALAYQLIF